MSDGVLARRLPQPQPPRHGQAGRREAGAGGPRVTQGTAPDKLRWHLLVWKMPRPHKGAEKLFRTQRQERSCLRTVRQPCLTGDFRQKFCFGGTKASVRCGMLPASCPRRCRVGVGGAARTPLPAAEGLRSVGTLGASEGITGISEISRTNHQTWKNYANDRWCRPEPAYQLPPFT